MIFPTPHQAAAIYDCLREFPPFRQWKLPPAEEVTFTVNLAEGHAGQYWRSAGTHHIDVSAKCMSHFNTFVEVMAHEMIHLYQNIQGTENKALEAFKQDIEQQNRDRIANVINSGRSAAGVTGTSMPDQVAAVDAQSLRAAGYDAQADAAARARYYGAYADLRNTQAGNPQARGSSTPAAAGNSTAPGAAATYADPAQQSPPATEQAGDLRNSKGLPFATHDAALTSMNIKRLAGFQPVQVDRGWILRKTAPADQPTLFGVAVTEMPANRLELAAKAGNPQIKAIATAELGRRNAAISPDQD